MFSRAVIEEIDDKPIEIKVEPAKPATVIVRSQKSLVIKPLLE